MEADDRRRSPSPSLNFLSSEFDPVRVLSTSPSRLQLPYPTVQACDNLDAYRSVVQGTRRQRVEPVGGAKKEGGGAATAARSESVQPKRRIATVLDFMNNPQLETFSLLQHCHGNQDRVRVWIRHCAGVRGVCEGVLLAFDKHFNLVLGDASEEYTPFRTLANGGRSKKKKRKRKKNQTQSNPLLATDTLPSAEESREECSAPTSVVQPPPVLSDSATTSDQDNFAASTGIAAVSSGQTIIGAVTEKPEHLTLSAIANPAAAAAAAHSGTHSRHVGQLFIRGDNVVLIAPVQHV